MNKLKCIFLIKENLVWAAFGAWICSSIMKSRFKNTLDVKGLLDVGLMISNLITLFAFTKTDLPKSKRGRRRDGEDSSCSYFIFSGISVGNGSKR